MIENVIVGTPIGEAPFGLQEHLRRAPDFSLIDKLRHLLSHLHDDVSQRLDDAATLSASVRARKRIIGGSDRLFDGSRVCPDDLLRAQITHETVFSYLLAAICLEAISQASSLQVFAEALHGVVPELQAYQWYRPMPSLATDISKVLSAYRLWPIPIDLASDIYQRSLTTTERKAFGQYYTPPSIVDHLLTQAGYHADNHIQDKRLLDIATGFGVFLTRATLRLTHALRRDRCSDLDVFRAIEQNLQGYDVQPFAIIATKMHVLMTVIDSLHLDADGVQAALTSLRLPRICVTDTVAQPFDPDDGERPYYVVGNPPYGVCKPGAHLTRYADVLDGRINLYQLFLYFSVRRCADKGTVALLIPESLRSGRFFLALRRFLASQTRLLAMTDFHARQSLFPDVEQGVLIFAARKIAPTADNNFPATVSVVQTADDESLATTKGFVVPIEHIQMDEGMKHMLFKASREEDYALLHRLCHLDTSLPRIALKAHTGHLVWNRQRHHLHGAHHVDRVGQLPVIYAPSIRRYAFEFPPKTNNMTRQHLLYGRTDADMLGMAMRRSVILLQRTTSRDQSRRIIATLTPYWFVWEHGRYLIENHVNYIDAACHDSEDVPLPYVLGLLNSNLLNFLFAALSGTTQVSAWELQTLALVYEGAAPLATLVSRRLTVQGVKGAALDREIDSVVYDIYGLTASERALIETFHTYNHSSMGRRIERGG